MPARLKGLHFKVFKSLADMAEHVGPHGVARMTPGMGVAVGFFTGPSMTPDQSRGGHCDIGSSGSVSENVSKSDWNAWISDRPGGPPLPGCAVLGLSGSGANLAYVSADSEAKKYLGTPEGKLSYGPVCALKPNATYFCNVAGASGIIISPLGVPNPSQGP
jgi:hypothetical protein